MDEQQNASLKLDERGRSIKSLLSVVVPMFDEQDNLRPLFSELEEVRKKITDVDLEYILVDDGSKDKTFAIAKDICEQHPNVTVLRLARNYGGHAAIAAGISVAQGDCVMFIAGDCQDPPSLIPEMLERWRAGFKIVFAARTYVEKQPFSERFFSQCFWYLFNAVAAYPLPARGVDFVLMDRLVVRIIKAQAHLRIPIFSHVVETGFPCAIVKYVKRPRASGDTGWTYPKKFSYAFQTIYNSVKAFRILSALAGLACILSMAIFCKSALSLGWGWPITIAIFALHFVLLSLVLLVLLLAEHINLRLKGTEGLPRFVVEEIVGRGSRVP